MLEIERGRHTTPKTPLDNRLCPKCKIIEDERHFVINRKIYEKERKEMYEKITPKYPNLTNLTMLTDNELFTKLMCNQDPLILNAVGKFVYNAFKVRSEPI